METNDKAHFLDDAYIYIGKTLDQASQQIHIAAKELALFDSVSFVSDGTGVFSKIEKASIELEKASKKLANLSEKGPFGEKVIELKKQIIALSFEIKKRCKHDDSVFEEVATKRHKHQKVQGESGLLSEQVREIFEKVVSQPAHVPVIRGPIVPHTGLNILLAAAVVLDVFASYLKRKLNR